MWLPSTGESSAIAQNVVAAKRHAARRFPGTSHNRHRSMNNCSFLESFLAEGTMKDRMNDSQIEEKGQ
jgi:hypothetical protein